MEELEYCSYIYNDNQIRKEIDELLECQWLKLDSPINWRKYVNGYVDLLLDPLCRVIGMLPAVLKYTDEQKELYETVKKKKKDLQYKRAYGDNLDIYKEAENLIMNLTILLSTNKEKMVIVNWEAVELILNLCLNTHTFKDEKEAKNCIIKKGYIIQNKYKIDKHELRKYIKSQYFRYVIKKTYEKLEVFWNV